MIVTIEAANKSYDIQTDPENHICDTLKILAEKAMIPVEEEKIPTELYSVRKRRKISTAKTYQESMIYQGDILKIE